MTVAYTITALIVGCILLEVRHQRHLDRVARRRSEHERLTRSLRR